MIIQYGKDTRTFAPRFAFCVGRVEFAIAITLPSGSISIFDLVQIMNVSRVSLVLYSYNPGIVLAMLKCI